eukprot:CAMPEP_0174244784 /NCGR_PEP_ID=MMETSP0417-20130205/36636_1 /TAXON_ID=242541 /ORGANISM="Mayorella sp, Strain BSH-02190019" /LENGTH=81 /DNA_ID=CAMNT_0015324507 /DNA_START=12 /DNA_END=254 /DNA_ORIENTATION=+
MEEKKEEELPPDVWERAQALLEANNTLGKRGGRAVATLGEGGSLRVPRPRHRRSCSDATPSALSTFFTKDPISTDAPTDAP